MPKKEPKTTIGLDDLWRARETMHQSMMSQLLYGSSASLSSETTDTDGKTIKIGDRVEILLGSRLCDTTYGVKPGSVLEVKRIDPDGDVRVETPDQGVAYSQRYCVRLAAKGKRPKPSQPATPRGFKVGDMVEIIGDSDRGKGPVQYPIGFRCYVASVDSDAGDTWIRVTPEDPHQGPHFSSRQVVRPDQIRPVLPGKGPAASMTIGSSPAYSLADLTVDRSPEPETLTDAKGKELKAGQWVEVLNDDQFKGRVVQIKEIDEDDSLVVANPDHPEDNYYLEPEDVRVTTKPVKKIVTMESVILPADKKQQIADALSQINNHDKIFTKWGFDQVFEKGTAVSLLFWGVPGTGKTLASQAIADSFDAQLKIIGAGEIMSSEPGGAERTIQEVFAAATKANADGAIKQVLLFDECDSLLTDRNTVGPILGATINCLLTEIERYKGVVIFTTNRLGKLDAALERRISAKIEFPFPDKAHRVEIWKRMIPKKAPLDKGVDFTALAEFPIAGGNIKNAVLSAARTAARLGQKKITHDHLLQAAKAEVAAREDFKRQIEQQDHTHQIYDYGQSELGQVMQQVAQHAKAQDWLPVRMMGSKN